MERRLFNASSFVEQFFDDSTKSKQRLTYSFSSASDVNSIAKKYVSLDDANAAERLQAMTLDDIRDTSYIDAAKSSDGTFTVEKSEVSIQLKWLPDAQFMGYYVALDKGYYEEVGLTVNIVAGGGDIAETTAVNNGTVDFGVTWVSNLASANAGGMDLLEVAQVFQRSGLVLVYKPENFN